MNIPWYEIRVFFCVAAAAEREKKGYADFNRKGNADFLINMLGLVPIDQRYFSV